MPTFANVILVVALSLSSSAVRLTRAQDLICSVCHDGSSPIDTTSGLPEDDVTSFLPSGVSCSSLMTTAASITGNTEACDVLQLTAFQAGCCSSFDTSDCTLCPEGLDPVHLDTAILGYFTDTTGDQVYCRDLTNNETIQLEYLKQFISTPGMCESTVLRRSAAYCGCPDVNTTCTVCDGEDNIMEGQQHVLTGATCSELVYQLSLLVGDQCLDDAVEELIGFAPDALCCTAAEVRDTCSICSEQQEFVSSNTVSTVTAGTVSCSDFETAASLVSLDANCQALRTAASSACCVDVAETGPCELTCPDGSSPSNPFKTDPVSGHSCESLAYNYSQLSSSQCENATTLLGFDAVAFCCDDVAPPQECIVCQSGYELIYPERVLFTYNEHSCQDVASSLSYRVGDARTCQVTLDESRALHYCDCRKVPDPTPAPTMFPTRSPDDDTVSSAMRRNLWLSGFVWIGLVVLQLLV